MAAAKDQIRQIFTEDNITSVAVIYVLLSWGVLASDWVFKYSAAEPPVRCGKVRTGGSKSPGIITLQTTATPISLNTPNLRPYLLRPLLTTRFLWLNPSLIHRIMFLIFFAGTEQRKPQYPSVDKRMTPA